MPRFFVNIRFADRLVHDAEGEVFTNLLAAVEFAIEGGRELAADGAFDEPCTFDISDQNGQVLVSVPFRSFAVQ